MRLPSERRVSSRVRGVTYIEVIVIITLMGVLAATAVENLLPLLGEAERVHIESNQQTMARAVHQEIAVRALRGERDTGGLAGGNPAVLLDRPPGDYLGSFANPDHAAKPPGHWYFDESEGQLVYRVRHARYLHDAPTDPPRIRFELRARQERPFSAVTLEAVDDYRWATDGSELRRWFTGGGT